MTATPVTEQHNHRRPPRRANLVCGAVLLVLAAASLVEALRLKDDWQGARLMPGVLAVVLAALAIAHVRTVSADSPAPDWPDVRGRRRMAVVFVALVVYVALLEPLGFLLSTAAFVLALVRVLAAWSWMTTAVLTLSIALACHLVFQRWLGMPLP
jgi:putative tricarboxylic transport membrane protein